MDNNNIILTAEQIEQIEKKRDHLCKLSKESYYRCKAKGEQKRFNNENKRPVGRPRKEVIKDEKKKIGRPPKKIDISNIPKYLKNIIKLQEPINEPLNE